MKQEQQSNIFKGKTIEIINTDILPKNNSIDNNEIVNENSIELNEDKENDINNSNKQSTLDTNKNSILFFNSGKYFSFGKDNIIDNKFAPNTSSFNIRESLKKPLDNNLLNNNSFLNKKRKLMTSEELELEQIQREREEVKKMMKKNMDLYNRTKSGTTNIVSKVRETIHGLNNLAKNTNNNIINKTSGYSANFLREKAMNKINLINKK